MNDSIRVMLVEDNLEYRGVVELALNDEPGIELISQFGTAEIAIRTLKESSRTIVPDLILLDLRLPGMSGLDAISQFRSHAPDSKIVILTQSDQEPDVLRAIAAGAAGYLLKSATLAELTEGIRTVIAGGATLDPGVARFLLTTLKSKLPDEDRDSLLSNRELRVLTLLSEGYVKKEIAKTLQISYSTVDTHVCRLYAKLGVSNAPAAVNKAHRMKLFPPEE